MLRIAPLKAFNASSKYCPERLEGLFWKMSAAIREMPMEDKIIEAARIEIGRQADLGDIRMKQLADDMIEVDGKLDLGALAAAIAGSVAGGP
jgi:hypothetical protein